jgi:glutaredoxin
MLFLHCPAQENRVVFLEQKEASKLDFLVVNTTAIPQEVNLQIIDAIGLRGNRRPVTKRIESKDTLHFFSFIISETYSYNYNIQTKPILESIPFSEKKEIDIENGIVVFYRQDCPRSTRTVAHLMENERDFKVIDIQSKQENHFFMYQILNDKNETPEKLQLPVVLVNGSVYYNIDIPGDYQKMFD